MRPAWPKYFIVQALKESLTGNRIESLMGILNGTSNYILSEMTSTARF